MNGDQAVARILKKEGVEWIAAFPAQSLIDVCAREGIRPILSRQERAGVNMADGYSRIKNGNTIGVFTMQTGPGSENAFGGVAQAFADSVPILCLPADSHWTGWTCIPTSRPSRTTAASPSGWRWSTVSNGFPS